MSRLFEMVLTTPETAVAVSDTVASTEPSAIRVVAMISSLHEVGKWVPVSASNWQYFRIAQDHVPMVLRVIGDIVGY